MAEGATRHKCPQPFRASVGHSQNLIPRRLYFWFTSLPKTFVTGEVMKQRAKLASLLLALTVVCGIGVVWFITGRGFSAKAQPLAIEAFLARRMRSLAT